MDGDFDGSLGRAMDAYRSEFAHMAGERIRFEGYAGKGEVSVFTRGANSEIAKELSSLVGVAMVERGKQMPVSGERYLFCDGLIRQKRIVDQSEAEIAETMMVNAISVIRECDRLLSVNPRARICVIGSESAFKGSFDGAYAAAKAALHRYVETKRLQSPDQQLVCVAPTCIANTGMNRQRNADGVASLEARRLEHPKQRWLQPIEVARLVHYLLYVDAGYTTNTVIRMNGGEHCR